MNVPVEGDQIGAVRVRPMGAPTRFHRRNRWYQESPRHVRRASRLRVQIPHTVEWVSEPLQF